MLVNPQFSVNAQQLADLSRVLDPSQLQRALYGAVKRTTDRGRKIAGDAVAAKLRIRRKAIDGKNNPRAAIAAKLITGAAIPEGHIVTREVPLPLSEFKVRAKRGGVTVQIEEGRPALLLKHAFVARVQSAQQAAQGGEGHLGVFLRDKLPPGSAVKGKRRKRGTVDKSERVTPRGYSWRDLIKQAFGPTVFDLITRSTVKPAVESKIGDELLKQIDSQVSRFLKGDHKSLDDAINALDTPGAPTSADPDVGIVGSTRGPRGHAGTRVDHLHAALAKVARASGRQITTNTAHPRHRP